MEFDYCEYFNNLNTEKPINKKQMADCMIACAVDRSRPIEGSMNDWLEWNLDLFDVRYFKEERLFEHFEECQKKDPDYFNLTTAWFNEVHKSWNTIGKPIDVFGETYETAFQSGAKASKTGQFFTPMSIAHLMADIIFGQGPQKPTDSIQTVNDCCCGSGRLFFGAIEKLSKDTRQFYVGGDIDISSVMMCALNLMCHGKHALVVRQDALMLSEPSLILLVNEVDFPMQSGYMSISRLTTQEAIERGWIVQNGNQYTTNGNNYERICNLVNTLDPSAFSHQTSNQ